MEHMRRERGWSEATIRYRRRVVRDLLLIPARGAMVATSDAVARVRHVSLLTTAAMVAFAANSVLCRAALGGGEIDAASFSAIRLLSGALALAAIHAERAAAEAEQAAAGSDGCRSRRRRARARAAGHQPRPEPHHRGQRPSFVPFYRRHGRRRAASHRVGAAGLACSLRTVGVSWNPVSARPLLPESHAAIAVARTVSSTCINSSSSALLNKPSGPRGVTSVNGDS